MSTTAIAQRTTTGGTVVRILVAIRFCHQLQPLIGLFTDHRPKPYSLTIGMAFTLVGLVLFSMATGFVPLLCATAMVGLASAVFHPESSVFQVGGNAGSAIGPLLAAFVVRAFSGIAEPFPAAWMAEPSTTTRPGVTIWRPSNIRADLDARRGQEHGKKLISLRPPPQPERTLQ